MAGRIALGLALIGIALLDVWAVRSMSSLRNNPGSAWLVRRIGPSRAKTFFLFVAGFLALLGLATIGLAIAGAGP